VAKFNSQGELSWARPAGGHGDDSIKAIVASPDGNLFVLGTVESANASFSGVLFSGSGGFLAKYSSNGDVVWVKTISGYGLALDGSDLVIADSSELAKYDSNGQKLWSRPVQCPSDGERMPIQVDPSGNIYLAGAFCGTNSMAGNTLTNLGAFRSCDTVVLKFTRTGELVGLRQTGTSTASDECKAMAVGPGGEIFITGVYGKFAGNSSIAFGSKTFESYGFGDLFVAKLLSEAPVLGIGRNGIVVELSWPYLDAECALERSGSLGSTANWSPVPFPATKVGNKIVTSVGGTNTSVFFRLSTPF
jgi:hypothetical protein